MGERSSLALMGVLGILGFIVGGYLGIITERGSLGIIAVVAALAGLGAGVWIGQAIAASPDADER